MQNCNKITHHIENVQEYTNIYIYMYESYANLNISTCIIICTDVYVNLYTCVLAHVRIFLCVSIHTEIFMCMCMIICGSLYVYAFINICVCDIYIYMYTHIPVTGCRGRGPVRVPGLPTGGRPGSPPQALGPRAREPGGGGEGAVEQRRFLGL